MDKFISREKMNKKARKKMDAKQRAVWGISPVTRKAPDKKHYNRKQKSRPNGWDFVFLAFEKRIHFKLRV